MFLYLYDSVGKTVSRINGKCDKNCIKFALNFGKNIDYFICVCYNNLTKQNEIADFCVSENILS